MTGDLHVLVVLLCALVGSLLVSSCLLASLICCAKEYLQEKTRQLRRGDRDP